MNKAKEAKKQVLLNRFKEASRKVKSKLSVKDNQKLEVALNRGIEGLEQAAGILLPLLPGVGLGRYALMYDQVNDINKLKKRGWK